MKNGVLDKIIEENELIRDFEELEKEQEETPTAEIIGGEQNENGVNQY